MAAKAVVRDVGRVLGMPYGYVDRIAKLIPFEIGITLEKALQDSDELRNAYESEDEIRTLIDVARPLEGLARNAGTHAGGVVIAPSSLTDSATPPPVTNPFLRFRPCCNTRLTGSSIKYLMIVLKQESSL